MARIDLRSDTVTQPSPAMRRAMAEAEVGDDVFGDDPTVNALEERAAELLGKEAGLFVASGTMGNLVAQMAHLARGQETIAGREHHLVIDEAAGHAVIVGASIRALDDRPDGTMDPAEIEAAFRDPTDPHEPISGLVTIENTHAHSMGQPLTAGLHPRRSPTSPTPTASRSTSTAPGSGTRSSPRACARPTWPTRPTPSRSACRRGSPARSARWSSVGATSSGARVAPGRWSVAGCARPGSWPRPGWSPCPTDRTG